MHTAAMSRQNIVLLLALAFGVATLTRSGKIPPGHRLQHQSWRGRRQAFDHLKRACEGGTRPYGVTVKTFLAYGRESRRRRGRTSARKVRALGRGSAGARLVRPVPSSAVFLWQGVLQGPRDLARVQVPVPLDWLQDAEAPRLRLVASWDSPVNAAAEDVWACRHLSVQLRLAPGGDALQVQERRIEATQPLKEFTI